jgi:hypothetical protein
MLFGVLLGLSLPIKVPCLRPGGACDPAFVDGRSCNPTDLEPFGVYLAEWLSGRDLPIAYRTWFDCGV